MDEDEMTGGGGEGSETDDGLCDYERQRLQNIRKNHNLLRSLGWPIILTRLSLTLPSSLP